MRKTTPINPAMEILELQENTGHVREQRVPLPLLAVRERFLKAKKQGTRVLIENSELSSAHAVTVAIEHVAERWCLGYQTVLYYGQEIRIPHTIHYTDVYGVNENERRRSSKQVKIIFEGENPFE